MKPIPNRSVLPGALLMKGGLWDFLPSNFANKIKWWKGVQIKYLRHNPFLVLVHIAVGPTHWKTETEESVIAW